MIAQTLRDVADKYIRSGWTITSMTDTQFVATKRKGINPIAAVIGIIGLFFYVVPGLLILLLAYLARGTETKIVSESDARTWAAQQAAQQVAEQTERERLAEKRRQRIASSGGIAKVWHSIPSTAQALLIIALILALAIGAMLLIVSN